MPPKQQASKADLAKKQKVVEDKTFGLKNKNKSKNVQKYVQSLNQSVQPKPDASKAAAKKKKEEEKAREKELSDLFKIAVSQPKVPVGVDPKSILCEFFKAGQCTKGFKCKFSHDLNVQRKGEKIDIYSDKRDEETMEDWDQETLEKVVESKKMEYNQNKPTEIVLECWDRERKEMVAIKIVRGIKKYREAAMIEIDVLQQLGKHDKNGSRCVQLRNWFDYRNHICIVFERLGPSIYDFLRKNNYRSFPIDLVRELGRQLLECVAFMHDLHLIHTDLKPENILLVSSEYVKVPDYKVSSRSPKDGSYFKRLPKSSAIKVIDFGSTTYDHQDHNYIVSTRHYRAPEVILGLGWSYPCDVWSVGCILVELCSGEALFQTHENLEHLAMMERVLGPLPQHMLKRVDRHAEKYIRRGRLDWPEGATSRESIRAVMKLPRLQNLVMQHVDHSAGDVIDLLQGLLRYDPSDRLTARDALRHPFFTRDLHSRRL